MLVLGEFFVGENSRAVSQCRVLPVLVREDDRVGVDRPVDGDIGIIPGNAAIRFRRIKAGDLVGNFGIRLQRTEAVGEALRDQQLLPVFRTQGHADPLAKGRGAMTDIDRNVKDRAANDPDQLVLTMGRDLEMQTAQGAGGRRQGVVVLCEIEVQSSLFKRLAIIDLGKKSAMIAKFFWRNQLNLWYRE